MCFMQDSDDLSYSFRQPVIVLDKLMALGHLMISPKLTSREESWKHVFVQEHHQTTNCSSPGGIKKKKLQKELALVRKGICTFPA